MSVASWVLGTLPELASPWAQIPHPDAQFVAAAGLPSPVEDQPPYQKVLVDKFIAAKLRPHQVAGVRHGRAAPAVPCCTNPAATDAFATSARRLGQ